MKRCAKRTVPVVRYRVDVGYPPRRRTSCCGGFAWLRMCTEKSLKAARAARAHFRREWRAGLKEKKRSPWPVERRGWRIVRVVTLQEVVE